MLNVIYALILLFNIHLINLNGNVIHICGELH